LAGEVHERDVMYPEFIEEAKSVGNTEALRTFRYAIKAEAEHARMYQEALEKLPRLTKPSRKYYVCMACGYTTENLNFQRCLVCGEEKEKYVAVS
ncbi:MAG TPA: ferritin family protein, partial [Candidatus Binatia bacterium]|nr:ferritin family protein [Candidatus Binatia bacterium]